MRRIGILSDTHGRLPPQVFPLFEGVEAILHAGDVGDPRILTDLAAVAPVHAVCGNVEHFPLVEQLPLREVIDLGGLRVGMAHGHLQGGPGDRHQRLRAEFAADKVDVVVYGHTHRACLDDSERPWVLNPGTAGQNRGHGLSVGILSVDEGNSLSWETKAFG